MAIEESTNPNIDLSATPLEEPEDGAFATYANVINMDWTLYDLRIRFAELMQVPTGDSPTWKTQQSILLEKALITIPWHQAKALRDMLDGVVRNYESANGELRQIALALAPAIPPLKSRNADQPTLSNYQ